MWTLWKHSLLKLIHKQFYIFMSLLNTLRKHSQCRVGKVCEPLVLITGCPTFGRNNLNQKFSVVADQTCTTVRRNFGPFLLTKLFQFSNILGMSGVNRSRGHATASQIRVEVRIFFWWSHSVVDLLLCFGSLSWCIIKLMLSFNWWTDSLWMS